MIEDGERASATTTLKKPNNNNRTRVSHESNKKDDQNESELRAIRDFFFDAANIDASGFIDEAELAAVVDLSADEIRQIFDTLDADGDGKISIEQFTQYYKQYQQLNEGERGEEEEVRMIRGFRLNCFLTLTLARWWGGEVKICYECF